LSIIDKKGMLFGKINIIDLSLILLVAALIIPAVIFGYKAMVAKQHAQSVLQTAPVQRKWVTIEIKSMGVWPGIAEIIKEGDVENDDLGKKIGVLAGITSSVPSEAIALSSDATHFIAVKNAAKKDMTIMLKLYMEDRGGVLYYKGGPVKMGNVVTFSTRTYDVPGMVVRMDLT